MPDHTFRVDSYIHFFECVEVGFKVHIYLYLYMYILWLVSYLYKQETDSH